MATKRAASRTKQPKTAKGKAAAAARAAQLAKINTAKVLDKFYTRQHVARKVAARVIECLQQHNIDPDDYRWLEPSAGGGAILDAMQVHVSDITGMDIAPEPDRGDIVLGDFLEYTPQDGDKPYAIITNPPFGKGNRLTVKFLVRGGTLGEIVAMIVPQSTRRPYHVNQLPEHMQLLLDEDIEQDAFTLAGTVRHVPTCLQVWLCRRDGYVRPKIVEKTTSAIFAWVKPGDADYAIQRVGHQAGTIKNTDSNPEWHMFIKFASGIDKVKARQVWKSVDWKPISHVTSKPAVTKGECVAAFEAAWNASHGAQQVVANLANTPDSTIAIANEAIAAERHASLAVAALLENAASPILPADYSVTYQSKKHTAATIHAAAVDDGWIAGYDVAMRGGAAPGNQLPLDNRLPAHETFAAAIAFAAGHMLDGVACGDTGEVAKLAKWAATVVAAAPDNEPCRIKPDWESTYTTTGGSITAKVAVARVDGGWIHASSVTALGNAPALRQRLDKQETISRSYAEAVRRGVNELLRHIIDQNGTVDVYRGVEPSVAVRIRRAIEDLLAWGKRIAVAAPLNPDFPAPLAGVRYASFFSGVGGFEHALDVLGAICVFACEIEKHARAAYIANFGVGGELPYPFAVDITQVNPKDIGKIDLLVGGFPCQDVSNAGDRCGFGGAKSSLFRDLAAIAAVTLPKVILLENVEGLVSLGNVAREVRDTLGSLGYAVQHRTTLATKFGSPQARKRVFIVAIRMDQYIANGCRFDLPLNVAGAPSLTVGDILEPLAPAGDFHKANIVPPKGSGVSSAGTKMEGYFSVKGAADNDQTKRIHATDHAGITLLASKGSGKYLVGDYVRGLTGREASRMNGFPEYAAHSKLRGQQQKQQGNSVVVEVVTEIARSLTPFFTTPA